MNPLERLRQELPNLTKSEQGIANYILSNPICVVRFSLTEVARKAKASNTAIIRLCQKLGYQGYSEFKFSMSRMALSESEGGEREDSLHSVISDYTRILNRMAAETNPAAIRSAARIIGRANRLAIMGFNRTGFSASQFSYRLSKIGVPNHLLTDLVIMKDYMEILSEGDVCVLFSISTTTGNCGYPEIAKRLKERGARLIVITMNPSTPLRRYTDQILCLPKISNYAQIGFLDDQAIFFVFIEVLLRELAVVEDGKEAG